MKLMKLNVSFLEYFAYLLNEWSLNLFSNFLTSFSFSIGAVTCKDVKTLYFLDGPSYDPLSEICYLQAHVQLFSCMHEETNIKRLCPCRDFEKEQTALCKNCL